MGKEKKENISQGKKQEPTSEKKQRYLGEAIINVKAAGRLCENHHVQNCQACR